MTPQQQAAMRQALEALIDLTNEVIDQDFVDQGIDAIFALQQTLDHIEQPLEMVKQQPAAQKAAIKTLEFLGYTYHGGEQWKPPLGKKPEWLEQQPADEAVAWMDTLSGVIRTDGEHVANDPRYRALGFVDTRPQPAAWVGLTDDEVIKEIKAYWGEMIGAPLNAHCVYVRAIEQRLKEKNNGTW